MNSLLLADLCISATQSQAENKYGTLKGVQASECL